MPVRIFVFFTLSGVNLSADIFIDISNRYIPIENEQFFTFDENVEEIHETYNYNLFFGKIQETNQTIQHSEAKNYPGNHLCLTYMLF